MGEHFPSQNPAMNLNGSVVSIRMYVEKFQQCGQKLCDVELP